VQVLGDNALFVPAGTIDYPWRMVLIRGGSFDPASPGNPRRCGSEPKRP
jgi:hypothetical protein